MFRAGPWARPGYIEPGRGRKVVVICNKICTPSTPTLQLGKCPADLFRGARENGTHLSRATEKNGYVITSLDSSSALPIIFPTSQMGGFRN